AQAQTVEGQVDEAAHPTRACGRSTGQREQHDLGLTGPDLDLLEGAAIGIGQLHPVGERRGVDRDPVDTRTGEGNLPPPVQPCRSTAHLEPVPGDREGDIRDGFAVGLADGAADALCWRLLAGRLAGASGPGEEQEAQSQPEEGTPPPPVRTRSLVDARSLGIPSLSFGGMTGRRSSKWVEVMALACVLVMVSCAGGGGGRVTARGRTVLIGVLAPLPC